MIKSETYFDKLFKGAAPSVFEKAKFLRKEKTKCEEILWKFLRNKKIENCKFRRQHPISCYIADFYCNEKDLVIEIDGGYHSEKEQKKLDKARTEAINEYGVVVLRFTNYEIQNNIELVLKQIVKALRK
jgi:very-short-patch-repair endonuclease